MIKRDEYGLISQRQSNGSFEGGDSLAWNSHYSYLTGMREPLLWFFEVGFGGLVRHPQKDATTNGFGAHYKGPYSGVISRDQLTPYLACLIKFKWYKQSFKVILHSLMRLFLFSYNTIKNGEDPETAKCKLPDATLVDVWAMYLRMLGWFSWLVWPLLNILDIWMLLATWYYNKHDSTDPISFAIKSFVQVEHYPTLTSKYAWKILDKDKLKDEITAYWSGWRKNPDMVKPYHDKIDDL